MFVFGWRVLSTLLDRLPLRALIAVQLMWTRVDLRTEHLILEFYRRDWLTGHQYDRVLQLFQIVVLRAAPQRCPLLR